MGVVKTFDDDPLVLEQDVVDIRQLLDESAKPEEMALLGIFSDWENEW